MHEWMSIIPATDCMVLAILTSTQATIPAFCSSPPLSLSYYKFPLLSFLNMAHVKYLHLNILRTVLAYFYHGTMEDYNLQEFKQLLPPAAVCRVWRECMLPYVYHTVHLEYHIRETDEDNETAQHKYEWKSNIDLIASQQLSSAIKYLRIESFKCLLSFTDIIHVLDTFGFSSSHWRTVNVLRIITAHGTIVDDNSPGSSDDEALAAQLAEYFGRHMPNIGDLFMQISSEASISQLLSNKLVNLYIRQLHSLVCHDAPITFSCHSFSSRLRCLDIGIAPGVTNRLPQLLASPLERLELFDIPHNFPWWTFIGITPGHIEFTNLTGLALSFRHLSENTEESDNSNRQVGMDTVSLNIGCRKLFFPKLEKLEIRGSPYSDGALYSMFVHSPLQTVLIVNSFNSVQHMDPRLLFNVANINFVVHSVSPEDYNDYVEFYRKLLGTRSNVRVARLHMSESSVPLPIPSTIEWINLERLTLSANIHLASVIQAITQLPKLHTLVVENVVDEVNEAGAHLQAILRGALTQVQSIATSVKKLSIYSHTGRIGSVTFFSYGPPLVFSLDVMRYLTVLIRSLDKVIVPDLYVSDIKEFAVCYADSFPHLHDVKVFGIPAYFSE